METEQKQGKVHKLLQAGQSFGDKIVRGSTIAMVISGIVAIAIFLMLLAIWLFYWVRRRKCHQVAKNMMICVSTAYHASVSHTVFGLSGVIMALAIVVLWRFHAMRKAAQSTRTELNEGLQKFDVIFGQRLERAQIFMDDLQKRFGLETGKGFDFTKIDSAMDTLENIKAQLTPEVLVEYQKTVKMVKDSLAAANIGAEKTDALTMLKQAQRILLFASPQTIETTQDAVASITATWHQLSSAQRQRLLSLFKGFSTGSTEAGDPYITTAQFEQYINALNKMFNWIESWVGRVATAKRYWAWVKGKCGGSSCPAVTPVETKLFNPTDPTDPAPALDEIPYSSNSYGPDLKS